MAQRLQQPLGGKHNGRQSVEGKRNSGTFTIRTLGLELWRVGVKGRVSSEVLDQVTQKSGASGKNGVFWGVRLSWESISEVTARNSRDMWRWRSGAKLGKKWRCTCVGGATDRCEFKLPGEGRFGKGTLGAEGWKCVGQTGRGQAGAGVGAEGTGQSEKSAGLAIADSLLPPRPPPDPHTTSGRLFASAVTGAAHTLVRASATLPL